MAIRMPDISREILMSDYNDDLITYDDYYDETDDAVEM